MTKDRWPNTRASIIQRIRDPDDTEAWQITVELYTGPVYQYCLHKGLQPADALDVVQEVFSKLPDFNYRPDKGKFRAWLGTVTKNQVLQFWRKSKNQKHIQELDNQSGISQTEMDLDWQRISNAYILDKAVSRVSVGFDDIQWRAFENLALSTKIINGNKHFVWNENGSAQKVAEIVGKSVEWVYKTKSEILKQLRAEILFLAEDLDIIE